MSTSTTALHWFRNYKDLAQRQRDFVDKYEADSSANVMLQGPPGSGKTLLLVNLINRLRAKYPNRKIGLVTYTRSLIDMLNTGLDAAGVQAVTYFDFRKSPNTRYDLLIVDEVQDLPADVLQAIRNQATQVVVAGDSNQQIFSHGCSDADMLTYLRLKPEERFSMAIPYRLTPSVFQAARVFKPNVLAPTESNGKTDVKPEIAKAVSWAQEVEYIYLRARLSPQQGDVSAILFPSRNSLENFANAVLQYEGKPVWVLTKTRFNEPDYGQLNAHLAQHGIALEVVQNGYGSLDSVVRNKRVVLQTYHSAKGLDYHSVCLPGLNSSEFISSPADTLLYVALTRSRANICLSYSGEPHTVVRRIEHLCASIAADPKRIPRSGPSVGFTSDDF